MTRSNDQPNTPGAAAIEYDGGWYYGILRDAGGYRIVASGPDPRRIDREIAHHAMPTMVVTREDLVGLCISDSELRRFLPSQLAEPQTPGR